MATPADNAASSDEKRELTDYEKGYLDGLLEGTRHVGIVRWKPTYKLAAEKYLRKIGCEGWNVNGLNT